MNKKAKKPKIRPLAICVFRQHDRILVAEGYDPLKDETFYRPIGGGIHFGERGTDTIIREMREEISAEVTALRYLGTLENIFTFNGTPGHEIVLVYDGAFMDESLYEQERIVGVEDDPALGAFNCCWKSLDFFRAGDAPPLYPHGLLELLTNTN